MSEVGARPVYPSEELLADARERIVEVRGFPRSDGGSNVARGFGDPMLVP